MKHGACATPSGRVHGLLMAGVVGASLIYDPLAPAVAPKRAVAGLVAVAAIAMVLGIRARKQRLGSGTIGSPAGLFWLAFVALSSLSILWGRPAGLDEAMAWIAGAGVMIAAGFLQASLVRATACVSGWWVGTLCAIAVIGQWFAGVRGIALHGGQGNGNWLGLLLAVTLPLSAGFVAARWRCGRPGFAWGLGLLIQLPAMVLAGSRVAWIALGLASVVALLIFTKKQGVKVRVLLTGLLALLSLGGAVGAWTAWERSAAEGVQLSLSGRVWIWRTSLEAGLASLPFGAGLGNFGHVYLDAQGVALSNMPVGEASRQFHNATTAHQDWIQAFVDTGPVGLSLLMMSLLWGLASHVKRRDGFMAATMVAIIVCGFGDSPLRQPAIVLLMSLCLAAAPRGLQYKRVLGPAPWMAFCACSLVAAAAVAGWVAARWETRARDSLPAERIRLLERAMRLDGRSGQAALSLGITLLETGDARGALTVLESSRERLANIGTDVTLGNAWMELKVPAKAEHCYRRALDRHPGSFRAHANMAESLREQGKLEDASHHLSVAKRLYPGHSKLPAMEEALRRAIREREQGPSTEEVESHP